MHYKLVSGEYICYICTSDLRSFNVKVSPIITLERMQLNFVQNFVFGEMLNYFCANYCYFVR